MTDYQLLIMGTVALALVLIAWSAFIGGKL